MKRGDFSVLHLPDWRAQNPYQDLLSDALRDSGCSVEFADYKQGLLPLQRTLKRYPGVRVVHIHWIAPYVGYVLWSSTNTRFIFKRTLLALDILLCRLRGKKVIWTVHNKVSHESPDHAREILVRSVLSKCVSHLIFHSESARSVFQREVATIPCKKSTVIPHGNYCGVYSLDEKVTQDLADRLMLTSSNRIVLFFGKLRRYKGVVTLLDTFRKTTRPDLRLIIAGSSNDLCLTKEIEQAAIEDARIIPYLKFIPQEEVAPLHMLADFLVFPFERTLTSGSVILAMSLGKYCILPESAKVLDVIDSRGAFFFNSKEELSGALEALPQDEITRGGLYNREKISHLTWPEIAERTLATYGCKGQD